MEFDSAFVFEGDKDLQSQSKQRHYARRGSKSATMFKMAANTVQTQYDANERVLMEMRGARFRCQEQPEQNPLLEGPLELYSTEDLMDEMRRLEIMLKSRLSKPSSPTTVMI